MDIDSIPAMSVMMSQADVMGKVGVSLLSKTLDVAQEDSAALTKMMELSVNPAIGSNIDLSV